MTTAEVRLSSYKNRELKRQKSLKTLEARAFYILLTIRDMTSGYKCKIDLKARRRKEKGYFVNDSRYDWWFYFVKQTRREFSTFRI